MATLYTCRRCLQPFPKRDGRGRAPLYCSKACKEVAKRDPWGLLK